MSLRYRDGSYVGGCGAQIAGTITVGILMILSMALSDIGIDLPSILWTIIKWIILIVIVACVVLAIIGYTKEHIEQKKRADPKYQHLYEKVECPCCRGKGYINDTKSWENNCPLCGGYKVVERWKANKFRKKHNMEEQ